MRPEICLLLLVGLAACSSAEGPRGELGGAGGAASAGVAGEPSSAGSTVAAGGSTSDAGAPQTVAGSAGTTAGSDAGGKPSSAGSGGSSSVAGKPSGGSSTAGSGAGGTPTAPVYECDGLEPDDGIEYFPDVRICGTCVLDAERRIGHYAGGAIGVCWAFKVRASTALDSPLDNWTESVICSRGNADNCESADAAIDAHCCD